MVKGDKIKLIGNWLNAYLIWFEHVGIGRCAPLGEVAPSWGGSPLYKEMAPSPLLLSLFDTCFRWGEVAPSSLILGSPYYTTWCALLEEAMRPLLYKYVSSPPYSLVGAWEEKPIVLLCNTLSYWNKSKTLEVKIGVVCSCVDANFNWGDVVS